MALTFSSGSIPSLSYQDVYAPPPSQDVSLQTMPDVYVIPPEEEQEHTPPWCYFDAQGAKASIAKGPDVEALDVALNFFQQADNRSPSFFRPLENVSQETVIMPKRSAPSPRVEKPTPEEDAYSVRVTSLDSEIVEVIKVRRNEGISDVGMARSQTLKQSRSFRARATQAFRSIRNVGKGSRKTSASRVPQSRSNTENRAGPTRSGTFPRPTTPSMMKRKAGLTQLFTSTLGNRSAIFTDLSPSTTTPVTPLSRRPSTSLGDRTNTPITPSEGEPRGSTSSKSSFRQRISALDLHKLFNPSSTNLASASSKGEYEAPTITRSSKREFKPLPASSNPPRIPDPFTLDDGFFDGAETSTVRARPRLPRAMESQSSLSTLASIPTSTFGRLAIPSRPSVFGDEDDDMGIIQEASLELELRLDSLHFDSLQFNANEF